jgi:hypothetical protein
MNTAGFVLAFGGCALAALSRFAHYRAASEVLLGVAYAGVAALSFGPHPFFSGAWAVLALIRLARGFYAN